MTPRRLHRPVTVRPLGVAGLVAVTALLSACGLGSPSRPAPSGPVPAALPPATPSPSPAPPAPPPPTPTPSATPGGGPLAACTAAPPAPPGVATGAVYAVTPSPAAVELVSASGTVINRTPVGFTPGDPSAAGLGPSGVFLYTPGTGQLAVLGPSGPAQALATMMPASDTDGVSVVESPNGRCWMLSDSTFSASGSAVTRLYVGTLEGGAPILLTTLSRGAVSGGTYGGGFAALRWDAAGVLLGTEPTGVGGAGPFIGESYSLAQVVRLDPISGMLSASLCAGGRFGDVAADGTVACITGEGSDARIVVTRTDGVVTTLDTHAPFAGQVGFVAGSSLLTYCTSSGIAPAGGAGWTTSLLSVDLSQQPPAPRTLSSGDGAGLDEAADAWDKLAGSGSIAELRGNAPTMLAVIDLRTGGTATLAPATGLLGIL